MFSKIVKHKTKFIFLTVFLIISTTTYWRLVNHFYEQDEWMGVGYALSDGLERFFDNGIIKTFVFGEGRPVTGLLTYVFYTLSPFNYEPHAIYSFIIHGITSFFVYLLLQKLRPDKIFNILLTCVFLINANASQSVTWFSAANSVPLSTSLLIVSILLFIKYISSKSIVPLVFSYITFYLSFLTKEGNILFFLLFFYLLYTDKTFEKNRRKVINIFMLIIPYLLVFLFSVLRYVLHFFSGEKKGLIVSSSDTGGVQEIIQSAIFYPFEVFSQLFIDPFFMYSAAERVSKLFYENGVTLLQIQGEISSYLSIIVTLVAMIIFGILYMKKLINKNVFLFGLIFYVLAVLPYVIISKGSAYLESRYYYLPLVGAVVLFASIKLTSFKSRLIACGLLVIFLVSQFVQIQKILDEKIKISSVRKEIVEQIYEIPLNGIKHNLVYIESDTDYVVEGQKLPFQQGVGYMIMVLFYEHSVIPDEFLTRDYLWDIGTEGYVTNNENSFGYFVNKKTFEKAIEETSEMDHNQIFLKYYNNNLQINIQN